MKAVWQRWGTWYLYLYLDVMYLFPLKIFLTAKVPAPIKLTVKSMFSQGGIIRPHRARMSDKLLSQLVLKNNSRKPT